jgi:3-hydroxybutyryl-CoA dehydratase
MAEVTSVFIEDMEIGTSASVTKRIGEAEVIAFSEVSGDVNPLHLDEAYAATTRFKTRIAHGMLGASLFSTIIGTKLPGRGAIYLNQSARFRAPVRLGDTLVATCTVRAIDRAKRRVTLACEARVEDTVVIDGEALVLAPSRAEGAA